MHQCILHPEAENILYNNLILKAALNIDKYRYYICGAWNIILAYINFNSKTNIRSKIIYQLLVVIASLIKYSRILYNRVYLVAQVIMLPSGLLT
jgi:hypothetical protein